MPRQGLIALICLVLLGAPMTAAALMPPQWICRFEPDSAELLPDCQRELRGLVASRPAQFNHVIQLTVRGTTDLQEARTPQGRLRLSERRAQSVARFLVLSGIPADLIRTEAGGAWRPEPESRRVAVTEGWSQP